MADRRTLCQIILRTGGLSISVKSSLLPKNNRLIQSATNALALFSVDENKDNVGYNR